jgi:hypothetical protein
MDTSDLVARLEAAGDTHGLTFDLVSPTTAALLQYGAQLFLEAAACIKALQQERDSFCVMYFDARRAAVDMFVRYDPESIASRQRGEEDLRAGRYTEYTHDEFCKTAGIDPQTAAMNGEQYYNMLSIKAEKECDALRKELAQAKAIQAWLEDHIRAAVGAWYEGIFGVKEHRRDYEQVVEKMIRGLNEWECYKTAVQNAGVCAAEKHNHPADKP